MQCLVVTTFMMQIVAGSNDIEISYAVYCSFDLRACKDHVRMYVHTIFAPF